MSIFHTKARVRRYQQLTCICHVGFDFGFGLWPLIFRVKCPSNSVPHTESVSLIQSPCPSYIVRVPHTESVSLIQSPCPSYRVRVPHTESVSLRQSPCLSYRVRVPHTESVSLIQS